METEFFHSLRKEEKLKDFIFLREFDEYSTLLIRTLPWTILRISKSEVEKVKKIIIEERADIDEKLYYKLKQYGFVGDICIPRYGDFVTVLLILTTNCNLRCKYCLAGEGTYGTERTVMSKEVIDHAILYVKRKLTNYIKKVKNIDEVPFGIFFFGGEPLLYPKHIKYTINRAKEAAKEISENEGVKVKVVSSISTNGTLISDDIAEFCAKNDIEVIVSIDGPDHDKYRIYANGNGSLKDAIKGFKILRKYNVLTRVNSVIPSNEIDKIEERVRWFKETLLPEPSDRVYITFSFVRGLVGNAKDVRNMLHDCICKHFYTKEFIQKFVEQILKLVEEGYLTYEIEMLRKIEMGGMLYKCLAGIERIAIMPDGSVYPCQSFVDEKFKLGNIKDRNFDHLKSPIVKDLLMKRTFLNLEPCKDCWLQSICSLRFDCPSHSYYDHGGLFNVDKEACAAGYIIQSKILERLIKVRLESKKRNKV